jgi:hypothetical protein
VTSNAVFLASFRVYCDAHGHGASRFDATPWIELATTNAIRGLVAEKWTGAPPAA